MAKIVQTESRAQVYLNALQRCSLSYVKIHIKSEKITPFGGIYYANKAFYALSLDKVSNCTLGVRSYRIKKFVFHFTTVCANVLMLKYKEKVCQKSSKARCLNF